LEPCGRTVAEGFGTAMVVSEPTFNSLQVAIRIAHLSREIGVRRVVLVLNKCQGPEDEEKVQYLISQATFDDVYPLPLDQAVRDHEPDISPLIDAGGPFIQAVRRLSESLAL